MRPRKAESGLRTLRRGQIIAGARALVAADGLDALTIAALEAQLGFSRGVITYHFEDKDEIVEAVLQSAVDEIDLGTDLELQRSSTLEEKVRAVLASKLRGFLERREAWRILLSFWGRVGDARVQKINAALFARYRGQAARLAGAARRAGARIDAPAVAALLVGIVIGLVVQAVIDPAGFDVEAALDEAARALAGRLQER